MKPLTVFFARLELSGQWMLFLPSLLYVIQNNLLIFGAQRLVSNSLCLVPLAFFIRTIYVRHYVICLYLSLPPTAHHVPRVHHFGIEHRSSAVKFGLVEKTYTAATTIHMPARSEEVKAILPVATE
jgi:hypothetical protein